MKKLLLLFVFCVSFFSFSQEIKRENIKGKILVEGSDIQGITIYNSSSSMGTVTNEKGEFTIEMGSKDLIEIRALKYQNLNVRVNKSILESKKISIFLIEEINELDEIVITNKQLTGNLNTDVKRVKMFEPKLDVIYFGIKNKEASNFSDGNSSQVESIGKHLQTETLVDGLNIVNIVDQLLIPLFRSEVADKKTVGIPEVPAKFIKYYFGSNFLAENFNVPKHRVEEFIRYVEDETFNFDLLNYGHEIEFLELLSKKSKMFLNATSSTD
jgi:hypothetical protein